MRERKNGFSLTNGARRALAFGAAALLAAALWSPASAQEDLFDDASEPSNRARVRYLEGAIDIERLSEDRFEEGTINAPVFPGDVIQTQADGRAEIQLADGSIVRFDRDTRAEFRALADAYGTAGEANFVRLSEGALFLDVRTAGSGGETPIQIDTPLASIYVQSEGLFRVDVSPEATLVTVASHRGAAEVAGASGSVFLRSGQRTMVDDAGTPSRPASFNSYATDGFDRWNEGRLTQYVATARQRGYADDDVDYERIPDEVRPYAGELSSYGRWVVVPEYGYVWYPVGVGTAWRPYYYGHWYHGPTGWYWVSYDPWGWAPYHWGRWSHTASFGWVWVPGRVFSGAWVSWYYGPTYVGWCPLDYYNRPAFIRIGFSIGGWGCDPHVWSFVPYNRIVVKNVNKVVVKNIVVSDLQRGTVVRRAVPRGPEAFRSDAGSRARIVDDARRLAVRDRGLPAQGERVARSPGNPARSFRETERAALGRARRGEFTAAPAPSRVRDAAAPRATVPSRGPSRPVAAPAERSIPRRGEEARVPAAPRTVPRATPRATPGAGRPEAAPPRPQRAAPAPRSFPRQPVAPRGVAPQGPGSQEERLRRLFREADRPRQGAPSGQAAQGRDLRPRGTIAPRPGDPRRPAEAARPRGGRAPERSEGAKESGKSSGGKQSGGKSEAKKKNDKKK